MTSWPPSWALGGHDQVGPLDQPVYLCSRYLPTYGSLMPASIPIPTLLFCKTHALGSLGISVSEKKMKNCIVKIIDNVFKK